MLDRRANLRAEAADQRIPRAAHHRRSGPGAEPHRQLETGAVERARHAGGAANECRWCSTSRWSTASAAAAGRTCCAPSTSKSTAASSRARPRANPVIETVLRLRRASAAGLASGGGAADRRRHHRGAARLARFRAQAMAGAFPRDAGGRRAHRHHAGARAAGRDHRGRRAARCRSTPMAGCKASCA